ncbi:MAG: molybdopterin oxidoreductase family protein [Candidatus Promineifilaceae bacterium]
MATTNTTRKHFRTCNLCEAMCGIEITLDGDKILSIKGDKNDPFSKGHICPKAVALQDIYHDPDRLKYPVKRTDTGWEQISWDEAYGMVADNVKRIWAESGENALGLYLGNPNVHNVGAMLFGSAVIKALRTRNRFTATSVDQLPHHVASRFMYGHQFKMPVPDVDRTDYFLILGANPLASNGSIMTAGGIEPRMKAIQKRGGKIVVVDPRRTASAKMADEHFFVKPGSDVLLLLAMAYTLFEEGLVNMGRLGDAVEGLNEVRELVQSFSPERVAAHVGMTAGAIRRLSREVSSAESAAIYGRIGLSIQPFGGLCNWLLNVLSVLTGNLDEPGGMMFASPAVPVATKRNFGQTGRWRSRIRNLPEFSGELPVSTLAEEILTEGEGQIKGMITISGNPVLSTPNGANVDRAFESLDFYAAIDIYINETTRHADVILPTTTGLENDHYDISFHNFAVQNSAKYSEPLFEKDENQRFDWEIYRGITKALATDERPFNTNDPRNTATPAQMLDFLLQNGPYDMTLADLKANPHGIDLGPLQSQFPEALFTANKKIQLAPPEIISDLDRVESTFFPDVLVEQSAELLLIGRRDLRTNNSWMHNSKRLVKGKKRCTVMVNSADADSHNLSEGQAVSVTSRVGTVTLPVQITDDIMQGVVSIPHGWGHGRKGVQMATAQAHAGVSINDLTDEQFIDTLTGNSVLNAVPVTISAG